MAELQRLRDETARAWQELIAARKPFRIHSNSGKNLRAARLDLT